MIVFCKTMSPVTIPKKLYHVCLTIHPNTKLQYFQLQVPITKNISPSVEVVGCKNTLGIGAGHIGKKQGIATFVFLVVGGKGLRTLPTT